MKVEIYGSDKNFIDCIPQKQKTRLNEAVANELSALDDETIKSLTKAKNTLVVDVLELQPKMLVDARLFDASNMPVSGKMCTMEITKLHEFLDPKVLANHFSEIAKKLVENAKMLR